MNKYVTYKQESQYSNRNLNPLKVIPGGGCVWGCNSIEKEKYFELW